MKKIQTYLFIISLIIPSAQVFSQAENELNDSLTIDDKIINMSIPNKTRIDILRNKISYMVSEFYPEFADRIWGV